MNEHLSSPESQQPTNPELPNEVDSVEEEQHEATAIIKRQMGQFPEAVITFKGSIAEYLALHGVGKHSGRKKQ